MTAAHEPYCAGDCATIFDCPRCGRSLGACRGHDECVTACDGELCDDCCVAEAAAESVS